MIVEPGSSNPYAHPTALRVFAAVLLVATLALPMPLSAAAAAAPAFTVQDLGTLPGDEYSMAMGIDANGDVVGSSSIGGTHRAFVYSDGAGMVELAAPAGRPVTMARAISDSGVVVGTATKGGSDIGQAVRWTDGVPKVLGTLGTGLFSEARSVNSAGVTVGSSYTDGGSFLGIHAFEADAGGTLTDLTPGTDTAVAAGINDSGQVAGYRNSQAFRWENGVFTDLGTAGFGTSFASAINASGQVAGELGSSSGNAEVIFRYTDGVGMEILGGLGEQNIAFGINAEGDVVGSGRPTLSGPFPSAFLFTDGDGMVNLNALIDPASGWVLQGAGEINDSGQIAAWGSNQLTGAEHALRLTPVDTEAPSVAFVRPTDGATVVRNADVKIVASDNVAVAKVVLKIDGATECATASSILTCRWRVRSASAGPHTLTGVAIDTSGNRSRRSIVVTVQH